MSNQEKTVVQAVRESKRQPDNLVTLSNGIVLKTERVPNMIFMDVTRRFKAPKIPVIFNDDVGRHMENPSDPEYAEKNIEYQAQVSSAIIDTMILLGTKFASAPKGMDSPSDTGWANKIALLGFDPGDNDDLRYLMWVKYYAASEDTDITRIIEAVGRLSGVAEADVADAIDQFRSVPQ